MNTLQFYSVTFTRSGRENYNYYILVMSVAHRYQTANKFYAPTTTYITCDC